MQKEKARIELDKVKSVNVLETTTRGGIPIKGKQERFPASYARIVLENRASEIARNCRVYLTAIEIRGVDSTFTPIPEYQNTLRLRQSTEGQKPPEHTGVNLEHGNPQFFNVVSVKDETSINNGVLIFVQVAHYETKFEGLANILKPENVYRFLMSAVSENADCLAIEMTVAIDRDYRKLRVVKVDGRHKRGVIVVRADDPASVEA